MRRAGTLTHPSCRLPVVAAAARLQFSSNSVGNGVTIDGYRLPGTSTKVFGGDVWIGGGCNISVHHVGIFIQGNAGGIEVAAAGIIFNHFGFTWTTP